MVEFLTTRQVSGRIERIIRDAQKHLVIISPYIRAHQTIKERLEQKSRDGFDINLICREKDLKPREREWLQSMPFIKVSYLANVHAKCYANEHEALVTSMNLYDYSEVNNYEMGLSVSREADGELYNKVVKESMHILSVSVSPSSEESQAEANATVSNPWADAEARPKEMSVQQLGVPKDGFCLRCKDSIPADPTKPYCNRCYNSWRRYKNPEHGEKHCHTCGTEVSSTLLKPLCITCYRKYKDVFEFVTA